MNHAVNIFPEFSRWTICARVTSKSDIRDWSNSRGEGRVFDVDLIDESVSTLCPLVYSGVLVEQWLLRVPLTVSRV